MSAASRGGISLSTDEHYYSRNQLAGLVDQVGFAVEKTCVVRRLPRVMLLAAGASSTTRGD